MSQNETWAASSGGRPKREAAPARPVETIERAGPARPVLLLCDHAGRNVPEPLGDLGLPDEAFERHIAWDIGAAELTRALAGHLEVDALLCHVSRLVADPNRRPGLPSSIPAVSESTPIPGNRGPLSREAAVARLHHGFCPYHRAIARKLGAYRREKVVPAVISVHSFTPSYDGVARPWHVGVLWNEDGRIARPLLDALKHEPRLVVGDNQPYSGRAELGYTVPFHAERARLPHVTLEIRQDEIATSEGALRWARRLAIAFRPILDRDDLYRRLPSDRGREGSSR